MTLRNHTNAATERAEGGDSVAEDRKFVVALARGLDVLRAFRPGEGMLGNQEIAARTDLPKPTVSRLTYTLTKLGYLTHVERFGKYQIAPAALSLGYSALAQLGIRQIARPYMQALADYAGGAVALGARDRLRMVYVEHCVSAGALMVRLDVGSLIPMSSSALGRAYIAALGEAERDALFDELAIRHGDDWPSVRAGIEQAMDDIARRGFASSVGDWRADINGVGVPLVMPDGSGTYAFNCGAAAFALSKDQLENDIGPRLLDAVRQIQTVVNGGISEPEIGIGRQTLLSGGARDLDDHSQKRRPGG